MNAKKNVDRLAFLKETHRMLDKEIDKAYNNGTSDWIIGDMKKKKLDLKDQIDRMEKDIKK